MCQETKQSPTVHSQTNYTEKAVDPRAEKAWVLRRVSRESSPVIFQEVQRM